MYVHVYAMYIRHVVSARFRENSARTNVEYAVIRRTGACIASVKLAGYNSLVKQLDFSPKLPDTIFRVKKSLIFRNSHSELRLLYG